jgi:hypothetical protein
VPARVGGVGIERGIATLVHSPLLGNLCENCRKESDV